MAEAGLAAHLQDERSRAVRLLLATPVLDALGDPDGFRLVASHQKWLIDWFESTCGWPLTVDAAAGYARLGKRAAEIDTSRPLLRSRGAGRPFDRRRYELLCHVCAEITRHPVTTIGLLAGAITAEARFDSSRHGERAAFVDVLKALVAWGALRATAGEVDAFLDSASGNAILTADTARLHRLLTSAVAPSSLPEALSSHDATAALQAEPRYGAAVTDAASSDEAQRLRWLRHTLARRVLDNPVTHLDELGPAEREYLANSAGRRWLRERVAEAGFELEERREGLLAVDRDGIATDRWFPGPHGNAHQLALLLVDRLAPAGAGRSRCLRSLSAAELRREVAAVLARFPSWARSHRDGDGPDRLAEEAVGLLAGFGLVHRATDGTVVPRPAIARYRSGPPVIVGGGPTLFEEPS